MKHRNRTISIQVYLSEDEKIILDEKCSAARFKSTSAFIRNLILYGFVYDINYEHLREHNTTLSRIGNNLNQITKRMNTTGHIYDDDIKEIKELLNQVWQLQKFIASKQPSKKQ